MIFENEDQLTENKLILLFAINKLDLPLTGLYINDLMLEPGLMNYFTLQIGLNELVTSNLLDRIIDDHGIPMYTITEKGKNALEAFSALITPGMVALYDKQLEKVSQKLKKELELNAHYFTDVAGNYYVRCFAREKGVYIIDLKLPAADKKEAGKICTNWCNNTASIYMSIVKAFHSY